MKCKFENVGYQMMSIGDTIKCQNQKDCNQLEKAAKSPFYLREVIVTTFDSYVYNIARAPVAELYKDHLHMEIPRISIFTSFTTFDEAHLYGADAFGNEEEMFASLLEIIDVLNGIHVPILITSATLPPSAVKEFIKKKGNDDKISLKFFTLDENAPNRFKDCAEYVNDEDFINEYKDIKWRTQIIQYNLEDIVKKIKDHLNEGKKIMVVLNTPEKAIKLYKKLLDSKIDHDVILLHGLLSAEDRAKAYENLERKKETNNPYVLISTQIVEAGVNLSFDVLITEAAPPTSLAQRAGRVCRNIDGKKTPCDEGLVYIIRSDGSGVYNKELVQKTVEKIDDIIGKPDHQIEWRLYTDISEGTLKRISYKKISDEVFQNFSYSNTSRLDLSQIIMNPYVASINVKEWLEELCGSPIGRDPLFNVYIGKSDIQQIPNDLEQKLVALNLTRLRKIKEKLIRNDKGFICYNTISNNNKIKEVNINLDKVDKSSCKDLLKKLSNCILIASEEAYEQGVGLRV